MSPITIKDVKPLVNCFRNVGVDIVNNEDKRIIKYPIHLGFCALGTIMWYNGIVHYFIEYYDDVDKFMMILTLSLQITLSTMKLICFYAQKRRFLQLIATSDALVLQANDIEIVPWNAEMKNVRMIISIYMGACASCTVLLSLLPLLRMLYMYIRYDEVVYTLPIPAIFPYDIRSPLNYTLTYIITVPFMIFGVSCMVTTDGIFSWFVFSIAGHMRILRCKLAQMLENGLNADFNSKFEEFVLYHGKVITLAIEFDALFALIIFGEVTCSCAQLCFLVYEFAFSGDAANVPFFIMFASTVMIQLLIFCLGGEKVQNESEILCEQIYLLTPWQILPPKVCRLLIFPLMRTQNPLSLTGYFFIANRSLLVWTFRTAGSFTAALFAMKSKE